MVAEIAMSLQKILRVCKTRSGGGWQPWGREGTFLEPMQACQRPPGGYSAKVICPAGQKAHQELPAARGSVSEQGSGHGCLTSVPEYALLPS